MVCGNAGKIDFSRIYRIFLAVNRYRDNIIPVADLPFNGMIYSLFHRLCRRNGTGILQTVNPRFYLVIAGISHIRQITAAAALLYKLHIDLMIFVNICKRDAVFLQEIIPNHTVHNHLTYLVAACRFPGDQTILSLF